MPKLGMEISKDLASIPLFEGLSEDQHKALSALIIDRQVEKGQTIFFENEEGKGFYLLISGRVKIYKLASDGKEQIIFIVEPKEPFGEVSVFAGKSFPAYAEAIEKSRLFFLPRQGFLNLIQENPSVALNMLAVLSHRLRKLTMLIDNLSLKEVPGRLAAYLLYLSEQRNGGAYLELDVTKGQLAGLLGTIPETISRILRRMIDQHLIELSGRQITILDRQGLQDIIEGERRL